MPAPARIEQLERQQRAEDRGLQRSQQFQRYRSDDDQVAPGGGGAAPHRR
jgi:hypothetical protein